MRNGFFDKFEEWKYGFGTQLAELDQGEGQYLSPRLKFRGKHTFDVENLKGFLRE